jgi:hypothetical protein
MQRMRLNPEGRAKLLVNGARHRGKNFDGLSVARIADAIRAGKCEVTGVAFELDEWPDSDKNPYAPSLDRIDPSRGYSDDNVRVVIWAYNLLKGQLSDVWATTTILTMAAGIIKERADGTRH